nr:MAG TPA: hypothetical protein [Caudoviricetes sp.]
MNKLYQSSLINNLHQRDCLTNRRACGNGHIHR